MSRSLDIDAVPESFDQEARRQAIAWFVRLGSGTASADDHCACEQWRAENPQHERAWMRLQQVRQTLVNVPGDVSLPVLRNVARSRRHVLKGIACFAVVGGGWLAVREQPWQPYLADLRTAVGEQRRIALSDGSELILNTGSAVDIVFDARTRLLHLRAGELHLTSGHPDGERRPLIVRTLQGDIRALGTRFSVRQLDGRTQVAVQEHAVVVLPRDAHESVRVEAGQQIDFDRRGSSSASALQSDSDAWTRGQLVINDRPLGEVIAELARYRPGVLRCSPAVAGIRVSGVFSLADTDRTLSILADRFPIAISRTTRYWVSVDTRV